MNSRKPVRVRCNGLQRRSEHGAGIVEAVVGLLNITLVVVAGTFLLLAVATSVYYKQKLSLVTTHAAAYAASAYSWENSLNQSSINRLGALTTVVVNQSLQQMGLPNASRVAVEAQGELVRVKIDLSGLKLLGDGRMIPFAVSMSDQASALINNDQPPALASISLGGIPSQTLIVPAYGRFVDGFSNRGWNEVPANAPPGTALLRKFRKSQFEFTFTNGAYSATLK